MAGEGDHPLPLGPSLVADSRIIYDVVGQVRRSLLGDAPDLVLPEGHAAMGAVQVAVHARAGL